jgi:hypothetical protein
VLWLLIGFLLVGCVSACCLKWSGEGSVQSVLTVTAEGAGILQSAHTLRMVLWPSATVRDPEFFLLPPFCRLFIMQVVLLGLMRLCLLASLVCKRFSPWPRS